MMVGSPQMELEATWRERQQLHAFREGQRAERVSVIDRLRGISRSRQVEADLVCCPA
jgi:hypothetical protein